MRENRPYGSEGGEGQPFPTPIIRRFAPRRESLRMLEICESDSGAGRKPPLANTDI